VPAARVRTVTVFPMTLVTCETGIPSSGSRSLTVRWQMLVLGDLVINSLNSLATEGTQQHISEEQPCRADDGYEHSHPDGISKYRPG
jgi:hypothetical protein